MEVASGQASVETRAPVVAAFVALAAGAVAMGASPIFVRLADVDPFTSAFWRVALSIPLLFLWAALEGRAPRQTDVPSGAWRPVLLAGALFAGDLFFWHLAIVHTTVANATFLATTAPVWVVIGSGLVIGETVGRSTVAGLGLCLLGAAALIGSSWSLEPERLDGDLYGFITSMFFGGYFLAVRLARRHLPPARIMAWSSVVTSALLLVAALALGDGLLPHSWQGLAALVALAFISHVGGQGLLAYALGHLPAAFSSLVIFLEALAAALLGWLVLGEGLGLWQYVGGIAILFGIYVARPRRSGKPAPPAN
ncbi:MAG: DMT family transporter [Hyphomicrobiales bacterium]